MPAPVPTYDKFIEPILRFLAEQAGPVRAKDAHEAAANALRLTEQQRQETVSSGQLVYKNRSGWGHDRLKRSGYSSSPTRGFWQLTPQGREYAASTPAPLSADEVRRLAADAVDVRLRPLPDGEMAPPPALADLSSEKNIESPDDRLDAAVKEIRASLMADVLELLRGVTPSYFEHVVLDVLHSIGYGARRSDLQRIGGPGDGGVDGVISMDRLGLERIYVQAKRWQAVVGAPEVNQFFGALAGNRASKGIMITTSHFSPPAIQYAKSVSGIVLVDGAKLAELMIDHGVGVSVRDVKIPKLDSDYFDEGLA